MLERQMLMSIPLEERLIILRDSCEMVEDINYQKQFSPEQLEQKRVDLENVSIAISDLNQQKKEYMDSFRDEMKPLAQSHAKYISELKAKSAQVTEKCYKFIDEEDRMVGYYNGEGTLVYSRPATRDEINRTITMQIRRTGTHD